MVKAILINLLIIAILIPTSLITTGASNQAAADSWLGDWSERVTVYIDHTNIDSNLSNFPVLLKLGTSVGKNSQDISHIFDKLQSDNNRKKIAVTTGDGQTQCYVEIVQWSNASEKAFLHVRVPSISSSAETILYLYYDSTQPDNTTYVGDVGSIAGNAVWDSNFTHVYHFTEQGNGTPGEYRDSKDSLGATGGGGNALQTPVRVSSLVGYGQNFGGPNKKDYIQIPDNDDFSVTTTNYLTMSFWFNPDTLRFPTESGKGYIRYLGKGGSDSQEWQFVWYTDDTDYPAYARSWQTLYIYNRDATHGLGASTEDPPGAEIFTQAGVWYYITAYMNNETKDILLNIRGASETPFIRYNYLDRNLLLENGDSPVNIGAQHANEYNAYEWLDGSIAELRFSNNIRSNAWIDASYHSGKDNLLTFSSPETIVPNYDNDDSVNSSDSGSGDSDDFYVENPPIDDVNPNDDFYVENPPINDVNPNQDITGVVNYVNPSGQFNIAVSVPSSDNKLRIDIPKDTVGTNTMDLRLTSIGIEKITTDVLPPDDGVIVGSVYDITPDGANFEPSINLVMSYADSEVPYGVSEKNLIVGCFDENSGVWNPVPSSTNPVDNTVTASLEHFSRYAILAYTNPANFEIADISMYPDIVTCGSNVDIQATIINTGDMSGEYEVNLMLDGEVLATELITLDGGEVTTLLFSTITDIAGIHRISIGAVEKTFTAEVDEAPAHFITSNINVSPTEFYLGESVEISTLVSNTGDLAGVYEAILNIDNETVDSKSVNVVGGDSEILSFKVTPETEGEHSVIIGNRVAFFNIKKDIKNIKEVSSGSRPEIRNLSITPIYDNEKDMLISTRIDYQIVNFENLDVGSMLILKVFRDGNIWEEMPLITLNQMETGQDAGYLSYVPSEGWDVGTYIFEAELKEQNGVVQSIQYEKFTLIEKSITKAASWGSLGIIIGGTLIVLLTVLAIVIYRKRDMLRGYVE